MEDPRFFMNHIQTQGMYAKTEERRMLATKMHALKTFFTIGTISHVIRTPAYKEIIDNLEKLIEDGKE